MTEEERIDLQETIAMQRAETLTAEDFVNFYLDAQVGYLQTLTDEQLQELKK